LQKYFRKFNFEVYDAEKIDTHGGSLRVFIKKNNKIVKKNYTINKILKEEIKFGIFNYKTFEIFRDKIELIKNNIMKNFIKLKNNNTVIVGFGAPAKATTAINYFGIEKFFNYVIEDNNLKHNKYIPGTKIKIISKDNLKNKVDYLIVLAWNFFDEIKKNNNYLSKKIISIKELEK
jgi:hypothetical protein